MADFLLQIVDEAGTVAQWPAGTPLERDLIIAVRDAIVARGVGFFRGEMHVAADIEAGLREVLSTLKKPVRHLA